MYLNVIKFHNHYPTPPHWFLSIRVSGTDFISCNDRVVYLSYLDPDKKGLLQVYNGILEIEFIK